jgi:hypothetical protein
MARMKTDEAPALPTTKKCQEPNLIFPSRLAAAVIDSAKELTGKVKDLSNALSADFARVTGKPAVVRRERREEGWLPEKFADEAMK